ncbi:MAG: RNA recognition motif domain-containing protein [Desulfovibrionales bacterium]
MVKKIFVGNIPWRATEEEIRELFSQYGDVHSVTFINDRETKKFRGFGFIEMDQPNAVTAIQELNASNFRGRYIRVKEAKARMRPPHQQFQHSGNHWNY